MEKRDLCELISTLNSNDLVILACVRDKENNTGICSARGTIKSVLVEKSRLSISTVNRSVKKLVDYGFLGKGVKQFNKMTYYITEEGKNLLKASKTGR